MKTWQLNTIADPGLTPMLEGKNAIYKGHY